MKSWKKRAKKLHIIQNWTFFHVLAWLPKRPILVRNRNLKGSPCLLSIYSLYCSKLSFCQNILPLQIYFENKIPFSLHNFLQNFLSKAESFYKVKNGLSFITSKSSSKNLSNVNKHTLCFQRIGIFIHFLSGKQQKLRFFDVFFDVIIVDR